MPFEIAARTDTGRTRDVNEDAVYTSRGDSWGLIAVADGMGGHAAGDVASEAALEGFTEVVEPRLSEGPSDVASVLSSGVRAAHDHLQELIEDDPSLEGMGTTLVAGVLRERESGARGTLVNVGDSRGYHLAGGSIEQVTVDQSLVQELVEQGSITAEEARTHPQRNVVSQALGTSDEVQPDTYEIELDGTLLLCSDGLTEEVTDERIRDTVREATGLDDAGAELIETANDNGGSDNVSVALGRCRT